MNNQWKCTQKSRYCINLLYCIDPHSVYYQDDEEAGPLELIKSQICDNVAMYAQKYDEEFQVIICFNF